MNRICINSSGTFSNVVFSLCMVNFYCGLLEWACLSISALSLSESGLGHDFRAGREFISAGTSQSKVGRQRQSQAESSISRFSSVLSKYWAADLKRGGQEGGEARGCCSKARDG